MTDAVTTAAQPPRPAHRRGKEPPNNGMQRTAPGRQSAAADPECWTDLTTYEVPAMLWETAAYYTFSTVAQTLAGALGLLGAFVIIRTTSLGQLIRADAEDLYRNVGHVGGKNEESAAVLACDWPRLVSLYRQAHDATKGKTAGWQGWNERHLAVLTHAEQSLNARSGLLTRVARALGFSVAVMGAAIAGLPLTPWLSRMPVVALSVLGVEALLAVVCLGWYARIVLATLRE